MYLIQCVNAYAAALALMDREWDYQTAHTLVVLKKSLQSHIDFFTKEEMKLVEGFAAKDEKGKIVWTDRGSFQFADPERAEEYAKRRTELGMVEVREKLPPLEAPMPEKIRPVQLEALEGFIHFQDKEKGEAE